MRRRHAAIAATTTVLCLGGLLAACGGSHSPYVAIGAAGGDRTPTGPVPPSGKVVLVPLDGSGASSAPGGDKKPGPGGSEATTGAPGSSAPQPAAVTGPAPDHHGDNGPAGGNSAGGNGTPGSDTGSGGTGGTGGTENNGTGPVTPPGTATPIAPGAPAGPAVLRIGTLHRAATDKRWCEKVTVPFSNTGGSPVASGTVTFSTHVIGGLGIDWATRKTTQPLPGPIAAGAAGSKTYTICVDDWRVPLGMHIETRNVSASWK